MELNKKIIEHFTNPKNVGIIEGENVYMAEIINPVCSDITNLYIKIENNKIVDAKFKTFGCAVTIASASALTESLKNQNIEKLIEGQATEVVNRLIALIENQLGEIPEQKLHCPPASVEALLNIFQNYYKNTIYEGKIKTMIETVKSYYKR